MDIDRQDNWSVNIKKKQMPLKCTVLAGKKFKFRHQVHEHRKETKQTYNYKNNEHNIPSDQLRQRVHALL